MIKLSQAERAIDGVNLAKGTSQIGASREFFNSFILLRMHVTGAASTKADSPMESRSTDCRRSSRKLVVVKED
jgi:hypothetical protein